MCNCHSEESIPQSSLEVWRPDDRAQPTPARPGSTEIYRPDILETIEAKIKELDAELRELSLDIHGMLLELLYGFVRKNSSRLQPIQNCATKNSEGYISSPELQRKTTVNFPMSSYAHDVYTTFMEKHGFEVTKQFHLPTAWKATFSHGTGGRTIRVNSEVR
jgi:hypothetical protein